MKNQEYTPGPWAVELSPISGPARVIAPNGCGQDCPCEVAAEVMPEDARLIAAAPELAEALARLDALNGTGWEVGRAYISRAFVDEFRAARTQARAALAKAGLL